MNQSDLRRNAYMLRGSLTKQGYMRWWHSFTGQSSETGESRTFFVEYFVINPGLGADQPILGLHPYFRKRGMRPSYVMVKAGAFPTRDGQEGKQLHAFYPISAMKVVKDPLYMQVETCSLTENRITGNVEVTPAEARHRSLMTDAGSMEWDLEVYKSIASHTGSIGNPFFSSLNILESYWHGEGIRTYFRGTVILDGIRYEVSTEESQGYADKHWGKAFNRPWMQFAAGNLLSRRTGKPLKHSALAIDGCNPRFLWMPLKRKLTIQLTYTGEDFEFNFAKPGLFSRCKWQMKETNKRYIWRIAAQNKTSVIKISCSCRKEQMMPIFYESPDGVFPKFPLMESCEGTGTVELYRRTPDGLKLIDTLTIDSALCAYRN